MLRGGAVTFLLCIILGAEGATITSYFPANGPVTGGTLITISGESFAKGATCRFRGDSLSSRVSFGVVSNSTHMVCTMPDVRSLLSQPLTANGTTIQFAVTGVAAQESFWVYDLTLYSISDITPNQILTNSTLSPVFVHGINFLNTGEITCSLDSHPLIVSVANFSNSSYLQCYLPSVPMASRQRLIVSFNGQLVGAIPASISAVSITFYSPPPLVISTHFRPSYVDVLLQFDREVEIGPEDLPSSIGQFSNTSTLNLPLQCSQVLDNESVQLIGEDASCSWQNSQQRAIIITLTEESNVTVGSVLRLDGCFIRTRYAEYSRLASGNVTVDGMDLSPSVVLEVPQIIPACGDFLINGDKSLYGGYRDLVYEWSVGMTTDSDGNVILEPRLRTLIPMGYSSISQIQFPASFFIDMMTTSESGYVSSEPPTISSSPLSNSDTDFPPTFSPSTNSQSGSEPSSPTVLPDTTDILPATGSISSSGSYSGTGSSSGSGSTSFSASGSGTVSGSSGSGSSSGSSGSGFGSSGSGSGSSSSGSRSGSGFDSDSRSHFNSTYNSGSGFASASGSDSGFGSTSSGLGYASGSDSGSTSGSSFGSSTESGIASASDSGLSSGNGATPTVAVEARFMFQLTVRNLLFGSTSSFVVGDLTSIFLPPVLILGGQERREGPLSDILLESKVVGEGWTCGEDIQILGYAWMLEESAQGAIVSLEGTRSNITALLLPPCILQPGARYRTTLTISLTGSVTTSVSSYLNIKEVLLARIGGGVRRSASIRDALVLDGSTSIIELHPESPFFVSWNCTSVVIPEIISSNYSCPQNFHENNDLSLTFSPGDLSTGAYVFTLTISTDGSRENQSALSSTYSQTVVLYSSLVPLVEMVVKQHSRFHSVLVHEKFTLEAQVQTSRPASVLWTVEYVQGYGQLQLNSNNTDGTPIRLSVCDSVSSCPFSESNPVLYTSQIQQTFVDNSSFINTVSLVIHPNILLPENYYRFKVTVVDNQEQTGFAEIDVYTESLPANGRLEITPAAGIPLDTIFEARSLGWTDKVGDGPFFHRFGFRYMCPLTDHGLVQYSASKCVQWMTGLSLDNSLHFQLPDVTNSMELEFIVQVVDRHGAYQEVAHDFGSVTDAGNDMNATSEISDTRIFTVLNSAISASSWTESLAYLTSILWSVHLDHEGILCDQSQETSPRFNLSNADILSIKITALNHLTDHLYYRIPLTDSYYQLMLSLLNMATKLGCDGLQQDSGETAGLHVIDRVLDVVEDIIDYSNRAGNYGILLKRGLERSSVAHVLSIYNNLIELNSMPFRNEIIQGSLMRVLPKLGYGACSRQIILETPVFINQNTFLKFKSTLTNLPYDYTAILPHTSSDIDASITVNYDTQLLLQYLQWPCIETDSNMCSGVCLTTSQIELDILWQGYMYSSLLKTSLLHMSLLNPVSGESLEIHNTSRIVLTFVVTDVFVEPSGLECVMWEETSLTWVGHYCQTSVLVMSSTVTCHCLGLESSFYSVVERCPSGFYGAMCNQTCPQGLWGSECRMNCSCSARGTCSPVNGSCDCDPGWRGPNCGEACADGFHGDDCTEPCLCQNGATCDHVTGECGCPPGWIGTYCNISCPQGFYGDGCNRICECSNQSQCDLATGLCSCFTGFSGRTCHDTCADGFFGDGCLTQCPCSSEGMQSCDNVDGTCNCRDSWVGILCDIQVFSPTTTEPPTTVAPANFEPWWVVAGILGGLVAALIVFIIVICIILAVKNRKKKMKVSPTSYEIEQPGKDKERQLQSSSNSSSSLSDLTITRSKSLEVLVPSGKSLKDIFPKSSNSTGEVPEFEEPLEMNGQARWQVIQVLSDSDVSIDDVKALEDSVQETGDVTKAVKSTVSEDKKVVEKEVEKEGKVSNEDGRDSRRGHEVVFKGGVYLFEDATLRELRNAFIDTNQLDSKKGLHFQFLHSDVAGDKIDIETEDEIMLNQIEHTLTVRRTIFIEMIDPASVMEDLCICGKFADLVCTSCNKKGYCSAKCQEKNWPDHVDYCNDVCSKRERKKSRKMSKLRESLGSAGRGSTDKCICGNDAEYECSSCKRQGYCSEKCQLDDWVFHEYYCNRPGSNRGLRKTTSSVSHRSVTSRENPLPTLLEESDNSND